MRGSVVECCCGAERTCFARLRDVRWRLRLNWFGLRNTAASLATSKTLRAGNADGFMPEKGFSGRRRSPLGSVGFAGANIQIDVGGQMQVQLIRPTNQCRVIVADHLGEGRLAGFVLHWAA
jgi:hypothetical protein